jgi:predicted flap endonuclease-1-like 5' DNA nuclease
MAWQAFVIGLIVGWLAELALDYTFWRKRRMCTDAEIELQEAVDLLKAEVTRLKRSRSNGEDQEENNEEPEADDLKKIWGIGPKIETVLYLQGITTFERLAVADPATLGQLLDNAGARFRISKHNVIESWNKQAQLAAADQWAELEVYQREVAGIRRRRRLRRPRGRSQ